MKLQNFLNQVIPLINRVTGESEEIIKNRLCKELQRTGSNVTEVFYENGLIPYVMNKNQEIIYKSDAFIYELLVYNISEVKSKIQNHLLNFLKDKNNLKILMYGDGIGLDSLLLIKNGYDITYYDYEGKTYEFAKKIWQHFEVSPKVCFAPTTLELKYDIIVAFDVLEHVENPEETIKEFNRILNPNGFVILTAPFDALSYYLPTHLYSNYENFHGRLSTFFKKENMYLNENTMDNLLVYIFQKNVKKKSKQVYKLLFKEILKRIKKRFFKIKLSNSKQTISPILNIFN